MKLDRPKRRAPPESTIALITLVFLMLIFFMLAGQIRQSAPFEIVPPASDSRSAAQTAPATLAIAAGGQLALNGTRITFERLPGAFPRGTPTRLRRKADAQAPAARVLAVVAALRGRGVETVDLLTVRGD